MIESRLGISPAVAPKVETTYTGRGRMYGYASVFYDPSDPGTFYSLASQTVERIMPAAFDRALAERDDVRGLMNHDKNLLLGRVGAGTVRLSVDAKGLRYEIDLPNTTAGRDVEELLKRGDLAGSSFAFKPDPAGERWVSHERAGWMYRDLHSVRLFDVGPVTYPAYLATTASIQRRASPWAGFTEEQLFDICSPDEYTREMKRRARRELVTDRLRQIDEELDPAREANRLRRLRQPSHWRGIDRDAYMAIALRK